MLIIFEEILGGDAITPEIEERLEEEEKDESISNIEDPDEHRIFSIDDDYFMFARITSWNQTQMSPSLWKISAIFDEFI